MLGLSTVHAKKHAMDLIFYELSAIVYKNHDNYYGSIFAKIKRLLLQSFYLVVEPKPPLR